MDLLSLVIQSENGVIRHLHQNELVLKAQGKNVMQIRTAAVYHVSRLVIIIIIRYYCNDKHVEQIRVFKWPTNHI